MFNEISLMAWMSGVIVFAIGGGAGFFIARQIKDKHTLGLEEQLEAAQNRLNEYQDEVNRHFLKTSLLFNKLTDNYREVYEHLATGAQKLCNDKPLTTALDLPETKILSAAVATGVGTAIANEEPSEVEVDTAATPAGTGHDDTIPADDAATVAAEEITSTDIETAPAIETAPVEDADLSEKPLEEPVATEPEPVTTDPVVTSSATETTDDTPAITEEEPKEEPKTLETGEQKKGEEEDIHPGAESAPPGVELEHHKTHPSIH